MNLFEILLRIKDAIGEASFQDALALLSTTTPPPPRRAGEEGDVGDPAPIEAGYQCAVRAQPSPVERRCQDA